MKDNKNKVIENGTKIKYVFFPGNERYAANEREGIELLNAYHGEYGLDWAVITDKETGKEIRRLNLKMCEGVEWETQP